MLIENGGIVSLEHVNIELGRAVEDIEQLEDLQVLSEEFIIVEFVGEWREFETLS